MHRDIIHYENMKKRLKYNAFLPLKPLYTIDTINELNKKFDVHFSKQETARRYVDALEIFNLDVLDTIFTPKLLSLIFNLVHDPVLYHCHSYEIDGSQSKPHIEGDNFLNGWHRDVDCIHDLDKPEIQHVSLFIYLTDVGVDDGAFEICDKKLSYFPRLFKSSTFHKIIGSKGHSFLFNRTAMHRASPNKNLTARRVLKISFQSKETSAHPFDANKPSLAKGLKLIEVQKRLAKSNLALRSLFGDKSIELCDAIKNIAESKPTFAMTSDKSYEIKTIISHLQEFRGYVRDLIYIINLTLYKIKNSVKLRYRKSG